MTTCNSIRLINAWGLPSRVLVLFLAVLSLQGCTRTMMNPPTIYTRPQAEPFVQLAPALEGSQVEVLYVTDRNKETNAEGNLTYGHGRSPSAAYGSAIVEIGKDLAWEDVVAYSRGDKNFGGNPPLKIVSVEELGRLPATPYQFELKERGRVEPAPEVTAELTQAEIAARQVLIEHLALTPRKEVFVGVHGVGNDFEDAVLSTAELWHFMGREGVPIAYTWPAGAPGLFFYTADRESGEFTVLHLKQMLKVLATIPEVEKIHILAHSRGTDVAMTALREMVIESRAAGIDPRQHYRIENVVLAAADIDIEVASQRMAGEALGPAFGRITVYTNLKDSAISASKSLFSSRLRLGALNPDELTPLQKSAIERSDNLDIIIYEGTGGGIYRHSYYRTPAVSSDMLMLLRYGWLPGEKGRRILKSAGPNLWTIGE